MSRLFRRLRYLLNQRSLQRELESDMEYHREMAAQAGRANFGNMLQLREDAREAWGWTWIDRLWQDMHYAFRVMARNPGFTAMAVAVLAIGIGINVIAFSLFDMVALRPLPVPDAKSLVRLERKSPESYTSEMSYQSFLFYRRHARSLSASMAVLGVPPVQIDNDMERTSFSFVTPNYFTQLGVRAGLGRVLDPAIDDTSTAQPVAVISYGLWQRRFAGDRSIIGRTIRLNNKAITIVGVTPYTLVTLGGQHPDIWMPIAQQPFMIDGSGILNSFDDSSVRMWGRLSAGFTALQAEQELRSLTNQLRRQHPTAVWDREFLRVSAGSHLQVMQPEMYQVAAIVAALTLLILAVACGNLGALLLARAVQREREIGIRLAIGANRSRIFRQLCTESLLLAALGAVVALVLGCAVLRIALVLLDAPTWLSALPDWRVILFTVAMSFAAALFFGFTPALQIARQSRHKTSARQILVTAQVACSCVLLIVAGLLVRAAQHALFTDPGFGYERLLSVDAQLAQHGYNPAQARSYLDQMQAHLLAVPGVRAVSLLMLPPLGHTVSYQRREIDGHTVTLYPNWASPSFFRTAQIPILLGRTFQPDETNAVIVSDSFARRQWPEQNPLGKFIGDGKAKDRVVGVAGNAHLNALSDNDALEQYWPVTDEQMPQMVLMVRTAGAGEERVLKAARSISASLDPKLFPEIRRIKSLYLDNLAQVEKIAAVVSLIGLVALSMAAVGVLGLVSFTVWQRTKDIAIRTALGASPAGVLRSILAQFSWPVSIGLIVGIAVAAAASSILRRTLYGVSNLDPIGYAGAIVFLLGVLAIAALVPARRALRLNVAAALHYE